MDQKEAQESLLYYLKNRTAYPVVALKGQWGGGKTHVWREVEKVLPRERRRTPLYTSLFGVTSISELKERLHSADLDQTAPQTSRSLSFISKVWKKTPAAVGDASKSAGAALGAMTAVTDEMKSAFVGRSLQNRLVVLDDLERCDINLSVISVLGFIEYLRGRGCQVLVIFNEKKFSDKLSEDALSTFREKVFDVEMQLETTPAEAFQIALQKDSRPPHSEQLGQCCIDLGVSNIRVARRIINVAKQAFGRHGNLDEQLISDSIPAVAVITALFYTTIDSAPTLTALRQSFSQKDRSTRGDSEITHLPPSSETKRLLEFKERHIPNVDHRFFNLLAEHVETGNLLEEEFARFWHDASERLEKRRLNKEVTDWAEDIDWHPTITREQLVYRAKKFTNEMSRLTDSSRRVLAQELRKLGEPALAQAFDKQTDPNDESTKHASTTNDCNCDKADDTQREQDGSNLERIRKLIVEMAGQQSLFYDWREQLERISVDQFVKVLAVDTAEEFKYVLMFLHKLWQSESRFDAKRLAAAVQQIMSGDGCHRRLEVVKKTGIATTAVEQLLLLAKGEHVTGWPVPASESQ